MLIQRRIVWRMRKQAEPRAVGLHDVKPHLLAGFRIEHLLVRFLHNPGFLVQLRLQLTTRPACVTDKRADDDVAITCQHFCFPQLHVEAALHGLGFPLPVERRKGHTIPTHRTAKENRNMAQRSQILHGQEIGNRFVGRSVQYNTKRTVRSVMRYHEEHRAAEIRVKQVGVRYQKRPIQPKRWLLKLTHIDKLRDLRLGARQKARISERKRGGHCPPLHPTLCSRLHLVVSLQKSGEAMRNSAPLKPLVTGKCSNKIHVKLKRYAVFDWLFQYVS